eukprot:365912-Chlamydomonas_euryale.AAC.7
MGISLALQVPIWVYGDLHPHTKSPNERGIGQYLGKRWASTALHIGCKCISADRPKLGVLSRGWQGHKGANCAWNASCERPHCHLAEGALHAQLDQFLCIALTECAAVIQAEATTGDVSGLKRADFAYMQTSPLGPCTTDPAFLASLCTVLSLSVPPVANPARAQFGSQT